MGLLVGGLEQFFQLRTSTGWWFGTMEFYDFPYIGNFIIPIDELIFFRGVGIPPTRDYMGYFMGWLVAMPWLWLCIRIYPELFRMSKVRFLKATVKPILDGLILCNLFNLFLKRTSFKKLW